MAIRIPAVISGSTIRISNRDLYDIDPPYNNELLSYGPVSISTISDHGGYQKPRLGAISLSLRLFEDDWPPPQTATFPLQWDTTVLVNATGYLKDYTRERANYNLLGEEFTQKISPVTLDDTLINLFTTAATALSLSLDTSKATAVDIYYDLADERYYLDVLDQMAAYANHGFYIDGTTLYLVDMLTNNGTLALDEFDFLPAAYPGGTAYSLFRAGNYYIAGSNAIGSEYNVSNVYSNVQADIEAELARTKTILEKPRVSITIPIGSQTVKYGQKISFIDESIGPGSNILTIDMWARSLDYSINGSNEFVTITGEADIS